MPGLPTSQPPGLFHAAPGGPPAAHRLLLVSYAFPPDSSIGALRWEKLLGYAAERGWQADVIMQHPDAAEVRDDTRLATLPPGTRLWAVRRRTPWLRRAEQWLSSRLRATSGSLSLALRSTSTGSDSAGSWAGPIAEPGLRGRLRAWRRGYLARMHFREWRACARESADLGVALAQSTRYDVVVSCGPPQMAHEAARLIAQRTALPFVMDLRDQFFADETQPPALRSHAWRRLARRYEGRCVAAARLVVANTPAIEAILRARYPAIASRFLTVTNGADRDVRSSRPLASVFTVTHAGSLYNGRDPRSLLRACRVAIEQLGVGPDAFRIHLLGEAEYEGLAVARIAEQEGVAAYTLVEPMKPRGEAIRIQEESAVLVVLPQFQVECIPGKVFDYVQLSSWLLALTEPGTATELLLRGSGADILPPHDAEAIGRRLAERFREFHAGGRPGPVNADGRFDRRVQAERLFDALEQRVVGAASR